MTLELLNKICEENNVPKDVHLRSDSGWECSPTEMNGVWFDALRNEMIITQGYHEVDEYLDYKCLYGKGVEKRQPAEENMNVSMMENKFKTYLGEDYSSTNHIKNFCQYWLKAFEEKEKYSEEEFDQWGSLNDMDCIYYNGNLNADTLMSAWTPIKWVAEFLNKEYGMKFYKYDRYAQNQNNSLNPYHCLRKLGDDPYAYIPEKHPLTIKLNHFLELAELPCNYILLPARDMNSERYCMKRAENKIWLYDMVPATLYNIFEKDKLGKYFLGIDGEVDEEKIKDWVLENHLEMGFKGEVIAKENVIPLIVGLKASETKWLSEEDEILGALDYMINLLEKKLTKTI